MMINANSSSSTRMRQYRRQMKKMKVFSGFTNQLKEVLGRLWGDGADDGMGLPHLPLQLQPASTTPTYSLGLLQGLRLLPPCPHWSFLGLLHGQQLKFCLHLPLVKGGTKAEL